MITYHPNILCAPWGALIGLAASAAGTAIGASANSSLNFRTRQWQNQQRLESQAYQTSEREAQNRFAEEMYNKYESPQAQVEQLTAAGLNPRLAAGSPGSVSASSGSSGSAPNPSVPPTPYIDPGFLTSGFQDMAGALRSLGEAKKLGIDTKYYEDQIKEQLNTMKLTNDLLGVQKVYANEKASAELAELLQRVANGKASEDQIRESIKLIQKEAKLKDNEISTWFESFKNFQDNLNADTDNKRADTNVKNTDVLLKQAQTRMTQQEIKESAKRIDKMTAEIVDLYATASGKRIDNTQKVQLYPIVREQMLANIDNVTADELNKRLDAINQRMRNKNLLNRGSEEVATDPMSAIVGNTSTFINWLDNYLPK